MHLETLSVVNFKNYEEAALELSPKVNCFVGNNGEGKTNLLDAIYYLSFTKSYFNPADSQNIRHGEGFFVVQGGYEVDEQKEAIYCGLKRGQKKSFKRNKKDYDRLADHIGLFPLVMISPSDSELISEGSEVRRRFMDGVISQYDKSYLDKLLAYNRVLQQRNALLKHFAAERRFDATTLEVFNEQLAQLGAPVFEKRKDFLDRFIPIFSEYYEQISGKAETVGLSYKSQLADSDLVTLLKEAERKDRMMGHTTAGVHKDDLVFMLGDHPIKKLGSQGQQKSYLIALKLAQFDFIAGVTGKKPLLLLDDVFDKLDAKRVTALMTLVSNNRFGQIFVTHTDGERIRSIFEQIGFEPRIFVIENGALQV